MTRESVLLPWVTTRRTGAFALRPHAYVSAAASAHRHPPPLQRPCPCRRTPSDRDTAQ
ncbi:hypothetical protein [Streptomyces sioyaensis]|uniref:hypothetical protein n=1 Tax=Streptomyces sioyaensis TaxID=67364 RepID=UPI003D704B8C